MEPIVVGTDGSWQAGQAVAWAAMDAVRKSRPLHIVHSRASARSAPEDGGERLLTAARGLAGERRPELTVTCELCEEPPAAALSGYADSAAEIVIGHRGWSRLRGLLLGSTALRLTGLVPGPVVVVRGPAVRNHATVLAAVDGYDISASALEYACTTATAHGSRLQVVEVWPVPAKLREPRYSTMIRLAVGDAAIRLREAIAPWRAEFPGLHITERVMPGDRVSTLVALSAQSDLTVLGSRGLNRLQSAIAGSVSHSMLHRAHSPIAVVRPSGLPTRIQPTTAAQVEAL